MIPLAANPLIQVTPGLMIWTVLCFLATFFVLKRFAFGPIQKIIDERRQRIREALQEADNARAEARKMLDEHRALMAEARGKVVDAADHKRLIDEAIGELDFSVLEGSRN